MGRAFLILENGTVFEGESFGHEGQAIGELVFSTTMTGYLETITDPCHYGHIVVQTFPLIGNFGVIPEDFSDNRVHISAYIVRQWCQEPSNFRSEGNLDIFLRENRIPGICGIDTRALTRIIRDNGSIRAMVSASKELSENQWKALKEFSISDAVESVAGNRKAAKAATAAKTSDHILKPPVNSKAKCNVAVWDFGKSAEIIGQLADFGIAATPVGYGTVAEEILALRPDGIVLTDGPGNPADNTEIINEIKKLFQDRGKIMPIFGVGLGHQMLALAKGATTVKLPFGHRGTNHPVRETATGRAFVTKQNHGFTVNCESIPNHAEISYFNANDNTCEGIEYKDIPAFSVEFHPPFEAADILFGKFMKMMEGEGNAAG